ncbi:hypothetical protein BDQ17DRAFT_1375321 [Cyathus striatus]|nr:hypothetical protein BDQ17DRAFT_1375321 [Cyathus striatus]
MHKEKHTAWKSLSSTLAVERKERRGGLWPGCIQFILREPHSNEAARYFSYSLSNTISRYSKKERKKYPSAPSLYDSLSGKLFPGDLIDKYPDVLNARNQTLNYWTQSRDPPDPYVVMRFFKALVLENKLETLLMLANHPDVTLGAFECLAPVQESSLVSYIFFNIAMAKNLIGNSLLKQSHQFITVRMAHAEAQPIEGEPDEAVLDDYCDKKDARLRKYMNRCFRMLYCYDMVLRECRMDREAMIFDALGQLAWV